MNTVKRTAARYLQLSTEFSGNAVGTVGLEQPQTNIAGAVKSFRDNPGEESKTIDSVPHKE